MQFYKIMAHAKWECIQLVDQCVHSCNPRGSQKFLVGVGVVSAILPGDGENSLLYKEVLTSLRQLKR